METYLIIYSFTSLIIAAGLAFIPATLAKNKGHSFGLWWFYGWMVFIAAIIHVNFIPDKTVPQQTMYPVQPMAPQQPMTTAAYQPVTPTAYQQPVRPMQPMAPINAAPYGGNSGVNVVEELKQFKALLDEGIITQEEFDAKKRQLLSL